MSDNAQFNVAIVSGICVKHDAISASVRDDAFALTEAFGFHTRIFTYKNEFSDLDAVQVNDASDIVFDPYFLSCDLIIYHFGIYYELFNSIFLGNGRAPQVVRYHNLTPREFLPQSEWDLFERSSAQLHNMNAADAVWAVSDTNRQHIVETGIVPAQRVAVIPLCVGDGQRSGGLANKTALPLRLLFVGRFVRSKGLLDLLRVIRNLKEKNISFVLRLVGDPTFTDPGFIRSLRQTTRDLGVQQEVVFVGRVTDDELTVEYNNAHILVIPSYHEGFCKPVIEAMRHGCIPITYDSTNLEFVARGLSRTVKTGDLGALTDAIAGLAPSVTSAVRKPKSAVIAVDRGPLSLHEYEAAVDEVLVEYGSPSVSQHLRKAAHGLISRLVCNA
jgi:glycosyltransferase involved in cell wall biosynthesis